MADITPHTVLDVDLLKIETGIHEKLSHEQLIWEYIDGTLEKVHSQQLEAMCFLLRAQNGVELTFLLVYILLHKAIGCLQQHKGPLKKWTESSKLVISISGATSNNRNFLTIKAVWSCHFY